jgi:hypothetical protein
MKILVPQKLTCLVLPGLFLIQSHLSFAQGNVGIGTNTPTGPLSFASILGNKVVLWGNGSGVHYGIGVQSSLLQLYGDASSANIAFGYGRSEAFVERARIINSGLEGMSLKGRLNLLNGDPNNPGGGGGVWLYKPNNTAQLGFMGTQNDKNIGFYGGPNLWGFTYDASTSRVGIGNNNPNAPLAFAPALGKKITLYPGATGDVGFGVAGNRLQIYSDNPNADVAMGYDAAGVFNERFAVKPTGALALMGNTGVAGEIITSAGPNSAAYWSAPYKFYIGGKSSVSPLTGTTVQLSNSAINLDLGQPAKLVIFYDTYTGGPQCFAGNCAYKWNVLTRIDGQLVAGSGYDWEGQYFVDGVIYASGVQRGSSDSFGPAIFNLAAGAHAITFEASSRFGEPHIQLRVTYQLIPQ